MYSLEFETNGRTRTMSVRFWKDDTLVRVQEYRCPLTLGMPGSYFPGASRLLSITSSKPKLVSVSGCSASIVQSFDDSEEFLYGVQNPFRFDVFSQPVIMHQTDPNVFGIVDMFSQLKFLVVALSGVLVHPWTVDTPELAKVSSPRHTSTLWDKDSQCHCGLCYRQLKLASSKYHASLPYAPA